MPEIHLCNYRAGHSICFSHSHTTVPTNPVPKQARLRTERDPKAREDAERKEAEPKARVKAEKERKARDRDELGKVRIATGAGGPARARSEAEI